MSSTRLATLLLLALLAINTLALDVDVNYRCAHDDQEHPEPEVMDIEEDYNPEGNDHSERNLASYNNMRIYGYYGDLGGVSSSFKSYIANDLIPPVVDYFSAALKVKYPVVGLWRTNAGSVCGFNTPSVLRNGVNADFVYFVTTDSSSSYVANTYTCNTAGGTSRPLSGKTTISTAFVRPTNDVLVHEKNMICMMHEFTHALGFSTSMYGRFLGSNGRTLNGHVTFAGLDGATSMVVNVEPLTERLRSHFGCSTLRGAYMENSGSAATSGSHFERKIFSYEMMTSGLIFQQSLSQFTLALLEGSGWYVADYSYADVFRWGQGQGCGFITGNCYKYSEYCSFNGKACSNDGRGAGFCSSDSRADGCRWVIPQENYDCDNHNADNYARLPSIQAFGRGENAKCFMGTLNNRSPGSNTNFCFKYSCAGNRLTVKVGNEEVVCTQAGGKSVPGYAGVIDCPNPTEFCQTVGAPVCPRNCMGRGECVEGTCKCYSGYKGTDCALNENW